MTALREFDPLDGLSPDESFWLTLVRSACHTVSHQPAGLFFATTVSNVFHDTTARERQVLASIARYEAEGTGLIAEIEDEGERITVRFSRPVPAPASTLPAESRSKPGELAGALSHLFRRQPKAASA